MQPEGSAPERAHEKDLAAVGSMHRRIADARGNDATEVACRPSSWVPTQQNPRRENLQCKGGGRSYELIVLLDSIIPAYLLLAQTRRHSGDRADIRLKIAIGLSHDQDPEPT
jgi:hypothetical protein